MEQDTGAEGQLERTREGVGRAELAGGQAAGTGLGGQQGVGAGWLSGRVLRLWSLGVCGTHMGMTRRKLGVRLVPTRSPFW